MDNRRRWHLDRGINPAYIIPLITAILAVLGWAGQVNAQQAVQDQKIGNTEKKVDEMAANNREDLRLINQKLDAILEQSRRR